MFPLCKDRKEYITILTSFQHKCYFSIYIILHRIFNLINYLRNLYVFHRILFDSFQMFFFNQFRPTLLKIFYHPPFTSHSFAVWGIYGMCLLLKQNRSSLKHNISRQFIASSYLQQVFRERRFQDSTST